MIGTRGALLARGFSTSSRLANLEEKKIGIIGMGNVGKEGTYLESRKKAGGSSITNVWFPGAAVATNLLAKNYKVETVLDKNTAACERFTKCKVAKTPLEVVEKSDIVITGRSNKSSEHCNSWIACGGMVRVLPWMPCSPLQNLIRINKNSIKWLQR